MTHPSSIAKQDRAHEREREEIAEREAEMAEAIDALYGKFDPSFPHVGLVTPRTRAVAARLAVLSDALGLGWNLDERLPIPGVTVTDAATAQWARVVDGWSNERDGTVCVLDDGTYLTRHERDGKVEWVEREPVARTFRAATRAGL